MRVKLSKAVTRLRPLGPRGQSMRSCEATCVRVRCFIYSSLFRDFSINRTKGLYKAFPAREGLPRPTPSSKSQRPQVDDRDKCRSHGFRVDRSVSLDDTMPERCTVGGNYFLERYARKQRTHISQDPCVLFGVVPLIDVAGVVQGASFEIAGDHDHCAGSVGRRHRSVASPQRMLSSGRRVR